MTLSLSLKTDKPNYAPGEAVVVTANYTDPATQAVVNLTGTVTDPVTGEVANATTSYTVTPTGSAPVADVSVVDDRGGGYPVQSNANGVATLTGVAAAGPAVVSGYGGAEPTTAMAGPSLTWQGFTWETEDWGTGPGQPKASNVTVSPSAQILTLSTGMVNGVYAGAEIDSARGDQGIPANPSTWGYGTYRWSVEGDLTKLPPGLCLGLFTFWAVNKGGPAGQKEIDIEFYSAGTITGAPAFVQFGYYADTDTGITHGVPDGHVLLPGSQFAMPAGLDGVVAEFTWLPNTIAWRLSTKDGAILLASVTATQGQQYTYTQLFGGNQFAGTVSIPKTGKQQLLANLWAPNGTAPPGDPAVSVPISAFTYTEA